MQSDSQLIFEAYQNTFFTRITDLFKSKLGWRAPNKEEKLSCLNYMIAIGEYSDVAEADTAIEILLIDDNYISTSPKYYFLFHVDQATYLTAIAPSLNGYGERCAYIKLRDKHDVKSTLTGLEALYNRTGVSKLRAAKLTDEDIRGVQDI